MSNLLRWQYTVPRLLAIIVALLAVQYGLGIATRSRIERSISARLGVPADLANSRVSYVDGRVTLSGLRIANPLHRAEQLLEAGCCDLDLDMDALLRHRTLVGHGQISGFSLFNSRSASGERNRSTATERIAPILNETDSQSIRDSLARLNDRFGRDWTQQFPSIRLTTELNNQSTKQQAEFTARANDLQSRAANLQTLAAVANRNPLRNQTFFASLPGDIKSLEQQDAALASDLVKLPELLETGRRAIVAARPQDEQFVERCLTAEAIDARPLANYLLRQQVDQIVSELAGWLRWTRHVVPDRPIDNITSVNDDKTPELLLRSLLVHGNLFLAGRQVAVHGAITDITTEPWLLDRPMQLRLTSVRAQQLDVLVTIDRRKGTARDELLVTCREFQVPPMVLGEKEGLQISLAPSIGALHISLHLDGDKLTGDAQLVQKDVKFTTTLGQSLNALPIANGLQETLGNVTSVATRVSVRGTVAEPHCELWSNLGPAVSTSIDLAVGRVKDKRARELLAQAQRQVDERLARLDRQVAEEQADMLARLSNSSSAWKQLAAEIEPPRRLEVERLGRLPAQSLFR